MVKLSTQPMEVHKAKRLDWLDMAKGWGILLVIIGHLGLSDQLNVWIYSFHMPLFFFLSGFLFRDKHSITGFVKKKAKSLLVPYLFLGLLLVFWYVLMQTISEGFRFDLLLSELKNLVFQRRWTSAWFLPCLFLVEVIYLLLRRAVKNKALLVLLLCAISVGMRFYYRYIGITLPWNLDRALAALLFFGAGNFFAEYRVVDMIAKSKGTIILVAAGSLTLNILLNIFLGKIFGGIFSAVAGSFPHQSYITAFAGILFVVAVALLGNNRWVLFIGTNSLYYFAIHQRIVIGTMDSAFRLLHIFQDGIGYYVGRCLMFIACLLVCTVFFFAVRGIKNKIEARKVGTVQ